MALTYADALTFVQNLTPTWVKPQQVMLAHLLQALQERPSLCTSELARALPDGPHSAPEQSLHGRLKRLNRFLDNPRLDEASLFVRWFHLAVRFSADLPQAPTLLPILLDTTYFQPFAALIASVPCGGRALPIAFTTNHQRKIAGEGLAGELVESFSAVARLQGRQQGASALVHPDEGRPQRLPGRVDRDEGLTLVGDRQPGQPARAHLPGNLPQRGRAGRPPLLGVLPVPAGARHAQG